jgi:hypothetical protein
MRGAADGAHCRRIVRFSPIGDAAPSPIAGLLVIGAGLPAVIVLPSAAPFLWLVATYSLLTAKTSLRHRRTVTKPASYLNEP